MSSRYLSRIINVTNHIYKKKERKRRREDKIPKGTKRINQKCHFFDSISRIFHLEQIIKLPNTQRAMKLNSPLRKKKSLEFSPRSYERNTYKIPNSTSTSARISSLRTKYNKITRYKRATKVNSPLFKRISKFHPFPFPFFFFLPFYLTTIKIHSVDF